MVYGFCRWLKNFEPAIDSEPLPYAAVLLSVRGESESLRNCLNALQCLEYPSFEIHIIVDHERDRSLDVINEWQSTQCTIPIRIHHLSDISRFSSLKTSAVRQCIQTLDDNVKAIAILDADTIVHRSWLRELVSPLSDKSLGASTGNRWYASTDRKLGNQIRFLYNAWAVPGMHFMNTVWGGSLGISESVWKHPEFLTTLSTSPTEEIGVQVIRNKLGLKLAKQGNLMMTQHGDISTPNAIGFITRQLVWTKLHYREWAGVFAGPLMIYLVTVCLSVCGILSLVSGDWNGLATAILAFLSYWIANWFLLSFLNHTVLTKLSLRTPTSFAYPTWRDHLFLFLMIPIGFVAFVLALFKAQFAKSIRWSGIEYKIATPDRVELIEYKPAQRS